MGTVNFLPMMVKREDAGENIVGEIGHRTGGSGEHHRVEFFEVTDEETIRRAANSLAEKVCFYPSGLPPQGHGHLDSKYEEEGA